MLKEDLTIIILQVTLSITFIVIFFFTYGSYLESKVVREQVDYVVSDLMTDVKIIDGAQLELLKDIANNIKTPDMTKQDQQAEIYNRNIMIKAFLIFGTLFIVGISFTIFMITYYKLDYKRVLTHSSIAILAVMIVYFLYTTFVLGNFHSADPNGVKKAIVESLINFEKK